jgi:hypothetical protein
MLAGLMWCVGYAGLSESLVPAIGQLGGHVILGLAGLLTLLALTGMLVRDGGRSSWLGTAGYALSLPGAAVFSIGNLAEGLWLLEFGTRLFAVGIMSLIAGVVLLGFGLLRARVLPPWSVWPLIVGWVAFFPLANVSAVAGLVPSLLAAFMLGVGWATLGYALWSGKGRPDWAPTRALCRSGIPWLRSPCSGRSGAPWSGVCASSA